MKEWLQNYFTNSPYDFDKRGPIELTDSRVALMLGQSR